MIKGQIHLRDPKTAPTIPPVVIDGRLTRLSLSRASVGVGETEELETVGLLLLGSGVVLLED